MRAKSVLENINFERGKDPLDAMDLGIISKLDFLAKEYDFIKSDISNIHKEYQKGFFEGDKIIQVWQIYDEIMNKYYDAFVILFQAEEDNELKIVSNSMHDWEVWDYKDWLNEETWKSRFN